jgi:hypothetical protein
MRREEGEGIYEEREEWIIPVCKLVGIRRLQMTEAFHHPSLAAYGTRYLRA